MARKCSSCGNNGHNSRTCGGHSRTTAAFENNGGAGVRLFGVQLHVGSSSPVAVAMKRCFSMECLSSPPPAAPAYYAAALAAANSSSPSASASASSSSSLVSVEEAQAPEKMASGYLSDGLVGRAQAERKKGVPWTEDEHRRFLAGLEKLGKGDWRGISRHFVTTRTPTQVASHAQKYFLRQSSLAHKKRRSSLFDVVENAAERATTTSSRERPRLTVTDAIIATASAAAPGTTAALPALSLGIRRPARPEYHVDVALPPSSLSMQLPRCSAAMGSASASPSPSLALALAGPKHKHPSPSSLTAAKASSSGQAPDLELKISTGRQSEHQVQTGSPPRTPFLGTIRVT
ncbi:Transcription factor MYBS3 [Zea mays]|uniref:Transcription factor MYBS3 n=1 Tax=Zea mays TaxID=4577 RepID=A0A3L6DLZ6_MAIZE|nr:Transcription factor MYBS3 [Zea mays]